MTESESIQFKTTINCGSCIAKVKTSLDELLGEGNWQVDTSNPDKLLSVNHAHVIEDELVMKLAELGYAATPLNK
jgi:copper chaperone CopZ